MGGKRRETELNSPGETRALHREGSGFPTYTQRRRVRRGQGQAACNKLISLGAVVRTMSVYELSSIISRPLFDLNSTEVPTHEPRRNWLPLEIISYPEADVDNSVSHAFAVGRLDPAGVTPLAFLFNAF